MTRTRAIAFFLEAAVNGDADRRQPRDSAPPLATHRASGSGRAERRVERR